MPGDTTLASRIHADSSAVEEKARKLQTEHLEEYKDRQKPLEQLGRVFDVLSASWKPPRELLAERFGGSVEPTTGPPGHRRPVP
jgi:hypothetical protein